MNCVSASPCVLRGIRSVQKDLGAMGRVSELCVQINVPIHLI